MTRTTHDGPFSDPATACEHWQCLFDSLAGLIYPPNVTDTVRGAPSGRLYQQRLAAGRAGGARRAGGTR